MPAIPLIGLGVGAYSAYKQARAQDKMVNMQRDMMNRQSALAGEISSMGKQQMQMGQPALSKAMQYYTTLAGGGRGAINAAIAPERNQMAESYAGAERGMLARMGPGASRDRAIAEMYRSKAGQMGMMPFQARQNAMGQLSKMGMGLQELGGRTAASAANAYVGAANTAQGIQAGMERSGDLWGELISGGTQAAAGTYDWLRGSGGGPRYDTRQIRLNQLSTWKGR